MGCQLAHAQMPLTWTGNVQALLHGVFVIHRLVLENTAALHVMQTVTHFRL